jgi:hypothetical protein
VAQKIKKKSGVSQSLTPFGRLFLEYLLSRKPLFSLKDASHNNRVPAVAAREFSAAV